MKTILKLFSLKLVTSILGVFYTVLQVRYFGASRIIEVYFAAQSLVYLVTSIVQSGQLSEVFLPEYHKLNSITKGLGFKGLNVVINRMLIWGTLIILGVFLFADIFINILVPGFSSEDKEQATLIFRILLPYLYFQIVNSFFITVLNAEKKFGRAEILGVTNTIVNILCLLLLYEIFGIWALVISLLLGKIIEFFFYINQLYKIGYKYSFDFKIDEFNHLSFFKTMGSTILYVGSTQIYSIVLTAGMSFLPEGTLAVFRYVQNLAVKVKGLFIQPFITIFFTQYSNLLKKSKSVTSEFKKNIHSILNVNSILIIGTILLGYEILDFIWGGDKFDEENLNLAYIFLLFNTLGIVFSSIGSIYRKMAVSHHKAKKLYSLWVISQLLSALFSYFLIKYFKVNGLYYIIPINALLMGVASYIVYLTTKKPLKFNFFNKKTFVLFLFILVACLLRFFIGKSKISFQEIYTILTLTLATLILCSLPLYLTYKIFRNEKNIN
ncbi:murein biosynthesis integral membrane protein MurJ [Polaribacter sp. Hel_I_88]|uniref:murein biosynthesis integral membrane protein MurJ n=1 Tax=Polaribacter sp. Hel_I_88 TaxID=1250006 RepID=UPI00047E3199|nr:lipid II flippase MurJ [Polaribacter sp. Hel_I_88]